MVLAKKKKKKLVNYKIQLNFYQGHVSLWKMSHSWVGDNY